MTEAEKILQQVINKDYTMSKDQGTIEAFRSTLTGSNNPIRQIADVATKSNKNMIFELFRNS